MAVVDLVARGPHRFVIVTPVERTDRYGSQVLDYGPEAERRPGRGWIQARGSGDLDTPDRPSGRTEDRVLYTHHRVAPDDRIEHDGQTYLIDGALDQIASPRGTHHYRATLRSTTG